MLNLFLNLNVKKLSVVQIQVRKKLVIVMHFIQNSCFMLRTRTCFFFLHEASLLFYCAWKKREVSSFLYSVPFSIQNPRQFMVVFNDKWNGIAQRSKNEYTHVRPHLVCMCLCVYNGYNIARGKKCMFTHNQRV